jgi:hypothetical protein
MKRKINQYINNIIVDVNADFILQLMIGVKNSAVFGLTDIAFVLQSELCLQ